MLGALIHLVKRSAMKSMNGQTKSYTATVRLADGRHQKVFYGKTEPVLGSECPGMARPNEIVAWTFEDLSTLSAKATVRGLP